MVNVNNSQNIKHNKIMSMAKNVQNSRDKLNKRRLDPNIMNLIHEKVNKVEEEREKRKLEEKNGNFLGSPDLTEVKNHGIEKIVEVDNFQTVKKDLSSNFKGE